VRWHAPILIRAPYPQHRPQPGGAPDAGARRCLRRRPGRTTRPARCTTSCEIRRRWATVGSPVPFGRS